MTRRILVAVIGSAAVATVVLTAIWKHAPLLVWNASASVPTGLYAVRSITQLTAGDLVVAAPPEPLATLLADGRYLPKGVPLIKHVGALPGSIVCRTKLTVSIDSVVRAQAQDRDHAGHLLPSWSGCRTIGGNEVFLLNASEPASLDGRYFGPLPSSSIIGRAVPIWTETQP
jgi:conjugative transfer signal peptidase TraF